MEKELMELMVNGFHMSQIIGLAKYVGIEQDELRDLVGKVFAQEEDGIQNLVVETVMRFSLMNRIQKRKVMKMCRDIVSANKEASQNG